MINHDASSYQDIADAFAGQPVGELTRDQVLDNAAELREGFRSLR